MNSPSSIDSPSNRIVPSVSSPALVIRPDRSSPTTRKTNRKPFLLRSTTPLKLSDNNDKLTTKDSVRGSHDGSGELKENRMSRSKTEGQIAQKSKPSSIAAKPIVPSSSSSSTTSSTTTRSKPPSRRLPTASRITFVPDPPLSSPSTTLPLGPSRRAIVNRGQAIPTPPLPRSSARLPPPTTTNKARVVEERKMELKRESLLQRKEVASSNQRYGSISSREVDRSVGDGKRVDGDGRTSRGWTLRPVQSQDRRQEPIEAKSFTVEPDTPSPRDRRQPSLRPDLRGVKNPESTGEGMRRSKSFVVSKDDSQPAASDPAEAQARKKASYQGLSKLSALPIEDDEPEQHKMVTRERTGYTSLQEILTQEGYRDTRVLTPMSKARSKALGTINPIPSSSPPPAPPSQATTSLLALPQAQQVKEKTSMLSLRGLFSLWSGPSEGEDPKQSSEEPQEFESESPASPTGSGGTFTLSPVNRAREWVAGVALANAIDSPSPTLRQTPTFVHSAPLQDQESSSFEPSLATSESPVSTRSYSSSIVTASSIRSPPRLAIDLPIPTIAHSPPSRSRGFSIARSNLWTTIPPSTDPSTISTTTKHRLRHTVSESILPPIPHYQSFPFSPSSYDSTSTCAVEITNDDDHHHLLNGSPAPASSSSNFLSPSPSQSSSPRLFTTSATTTNSSSWLPLHFGLRQRTSQIFSLGLGLSNAATTTSCNVLIQARSFGNLKKAAAAIDGTKESKMKVGREGGGGGSGGKKPRLLRKAVSSAGLVRPILTTTMN